MEGNEQTQQGVDASQFFTPELEEKMREMSDKQMEELLKDLENTPHWVAILKYNQARLRYVQNSLFYTDPYTKPNEISRNQGIMLGISDLQNMVFTLVALGKEREKEVEKEAKEK